MSHSRSGALSLAARLEEAVARRRSLEEHRELDAYRLVHGAGDGIPGVELDRYGEYLVLSLREGEVPDEDAVLVALESLAPRGVYLKRRPKVAGSMDAAERAARSPIDPVLGDAAPAPLWINEYGVSYPVWLNDGLSTGIFLDQRENRRRVGEAAGGAQLLNLFAYTGAFTRAAVAGGAAGSVTLDLSRRSLERGALRLADGAGSKGNESTHRFTKADAFAWLSGKPSEPRPTLIVCDPPTFARSKSHVWKSGAGWVGLAKSLLRRLPAGPSELLLSSNDRRMTEDTFVGYVDEALRSIGRRSRAARIERLPPPSDHPAATGEPPHLKSLWVRV